jgi:Protein of unknown function (DUF2516)
MVLGISGAVYIPGILVLILTVWALIDAATKPDAAWAAAGKSKTTWIVVLVIGVVFGCVGLIASLIYLLSVRPTLVGSSGPPAS